MSFNILKFGTNTKKISHQVKDEINVINQDTTISSSFPDLKKEKNNVISLKKQIRILEKNKNSELKEIKIKSLIEKYESAKENLNILLNLNSPNIDEIDPLCSFEEIQQKLKLRKEFSEIINDKYKFNNPSPIQSCVIPLLLNNKNVIASSETGSGKTLSYLIPIIHRSLMNRINKEDCKSIIVLPTKELCKQIFNEAIIFSNYYTNNKIKIKIIKKSTLNSINSDLDTFFSKNDILVIIFFIN